MAAELGVQTYPQFEAGDTKYELCGTGVLGETEFHQRFGADVESVINRVLATFGDSLAVDGFCRGARGWLRMLPWNGTRSLRARGTTRRT